MIERVGCVRVNAKEGDQTLCAGGRGFRRERRFFDGNGRGPKLQPSGQKWGHRKLRSEKVNPSNPSVIPTNLSVRNRPVIGQ